MKKEESSPRQKLSVDPHYQGKTSLQKTGQTIGLGLVPKQLSWRKGSGIATEAKQPLFQSKVTAVVSRLHGEPKDRPKIVEKLLNKRTSLQQDEPLLSARLQSSVQEEFEIRKAPADLEIHEKPTLIGDQTIESAERSEPYIFTPNELAKEVLRIVLERNKKMIGISDNLTLIIVFLHRGLRKS